MSSVMDRHGTLPFENNVFDVFVGNIILLVSVEQPLAKCLQSDSGLEHVKYRNYKVESKYFILSPGTLK